MPFQTLPVAKQTFKSKEESSGKVSSNPQVSIKVSTLGSTNERQLLDTPDITSPIRSKYSDPEVRFDKSGGLFGDEAETSRNSFSSVKESMDVLQLESKSKQLNAVYQKLAVKYSQFLSQMAEFIPGRLYFDCPRTAPASIPDDLHIFNIDANHVYVPFYADFGPLNIANIYHFCKTLKSKLGSQDLKNKVLVLSTSTQPDRCTNMALLLCSYFVLHERWTPEEAIVPLTTKGHLFPFVAYRDAGYGPATYWIGILDCLRALYKGIIVQKPPLLDWDNFDVEAYEFYEKVENGDMNWIIPGFFMAIATPHDEPLPHLAKYHEELEKGTVAPLHPNINRTRFKPLHEIEALMTFLSSKSTNVKAVVRLNNKLYDRQKCLDHHLNHYELYFPDGSVPPWDTILKKFMILADAHAPIHLLSPEQRQVIQATTSPSDPPRGGLAIHCKAGLGRTGTLICCWMIKNLGWSAKDCICWCRLMRPGSVVGPQQNWLEAMEPKLLEWGEQERASFRVMTSSLKQSLKNELLEHEHELESNTGDESIAETTMGMSVPAQPRKDRVAESTVVSQYEAQQADTTRSFGLYSLRSEDPKGKPQSNKAIQNKRKGSKVITGEVDVM